MFVNSIDRVHWSDFLEEEDVKQLAEEREKATPQQLALFYELVCPDEWK